MSTKTKNNDTAEGPVTIKIFVNQSKLHLAKSFLESKDIPCFTKDELINQIYTNAVGGMKLQVAPENVTKAVLLLIEFGFAKKEDYEVSEEIQQMQKFFAWIKKIFHK